MIRKPRPFARLHADRPVAEVAHVDSIEAQERGAGRERTRRAAGGGRMNLGEPAGAREQPVRVSAPVIEVAGEYERRAVWNVPREKLEKPCYLLAAMRLAQCEVHAYAVQRPEAMRKLDDGMQEAPRLRGADRGIDVLPPVDRVHRQDRVAMVSTADDRVSAVGMLRPDAIREDLVLVDGRFRASRGADLLEEDEGGPRSAQGVANAQQRVAPVSGSKALVGIQREHPDPGRVTGGRIR